MRNVRSFALLTLVCFVLSAEVASARESGVQITRDGQRVLISKDVGDERWAITLNEDGSITGNVFHRDGLPPQFLWCSQTGSTPDTLSFDCKGADACTAGNCGDAGWTPLTTVTIPRSFLAPPAASGAAHTKASSASVAMEAASERASGLRTTPDGGRRTLISKDVSGERWAITFHAGDHTVTGNVFSDSDAPPSFLWCQEKPSNQASSILLSCFAAPPCSAAPCDEGQWTFVADVPIAREFLGLATCTDVSGTWDYSEQGTLHCTSNYADIDDDFRFGGDGTATITQSGCNVTIDVAGQGGSWSMHGSIDPNDGAISVSGPADILLDDDGPIEIPPGVSIGGSWRWDGATDDDRFDLDSSGTITARYAGRTILSCGVEGTHEFRR